MNRVDLIVLHASATFPSMDVGAEWIDRIHRERGFKKIGYHYVIKRDGTIEKGREEWEIGAHALGWNKDSLGVCLIGGLKEGTKQSENNFTQAQWDALYELLTKLHTKYPDADIKGHNELPNHTSRGCPCFDSKSYVAELYSKWNTPPLHSPLPDGTIIEIEEGKYPSWTDILVTTNPNRSNK